MSASSDSSTETICVVVDSHTPREPTRPTLRPLVMVPMRAPRAPTPVTTDSPGSYNSSPFEGPGPSTHFNWGAQARYSTYGTVESTVATDNGASPTSEEPALSHEGQAQSPEKAKSPAHICGCKCVCQ